MIAFIWPWAFIALPAPFFIRYLLPSAQPVCGAALKVPFYPAFDCLMPRKTLGWLGTIRWHVLLAYLIWGLLVGALSQPQWLETPKVFPVSGRNLLLAVDISGSMKTKDFTLKQQPVSRLQAVKQVASVFLDRRKGDRVGLLLFGSKAYLQVPLTFDTDTVKQLLLEAQIGWAGKETAIGDVIGLALKQFPDLDHTAKVLVLLTDGANTGGIAEPFQAAQFAAKHGLKIYTIGVGEDRVKLGVKIQARDATETYLDEHTLEVIARMTGGQYFKAANTLELENIYRLLQAIEPSIQQGGYRSVLHSLYVWPLGFALLLSFVLTRLLMNTFSVRESAWKH